jgi:hypothetical protein
MEQVPGTRVIVSFAGFEVSGWVFFFKEGFDQYFSNIPSISHF